MDAAPATDLALCLLALALGARHGLDADHLATIDGLTRYNAAERPKLSRACGALFSLGHGVVVFAVAIAAATLASAWSAPEWLEVTGTAISVAFLFGLGFLNLHAVARADPGQPVTLAGIRSRVLGSLVTVRNPLAVAAVGSLFALSFDTISQAALFALAGRHLGGLGSVLLACSFFVAGMLVVDGVNGLWISGMVRSAGRRAAIASRVMAVSVALVSLSLGTFTLARLGLPGVDRWIEGREWMVSLAVAASVLLAFTIAVSLRPRTPSRTADIRG